MGGGSWSSSSYKHYSKDYSTKSKDDTFKQNRKGTSHKDLSPNGVTIRESRDSTAHPLSVAIPIFLDVTGSMQKIPEIMVKEKLGSLMETLIAHDIKDAHVLFGAIGDHLSDTDPLQVSQYEAGTDELVTALSNVYLEGGGGGTHQESYLLAWYFAAFHTSIDCFEKRKEKGFLFTIGDEATHEKLSAAKIREIMGNQVTQDFTAQQLLDEVSKTYNVFHIHINETSYRNDQTRVIGPWKKLLGERIIICNDHNNVAELIASTVAVMHGVALAEITADFDKNTAKEIQTALADIEKFVQNSEDEVINF